MDAENGARLLPTISPLELIFHSLTHPSILADLDLITDRNKVRKLCSALGSLPASRDALEWRIDAELVGKTALFTRWERNVVMKPGEAVPNRGWRYEFHATAMESAVKVGGRSVGCHRLVNYGFGGLKMLVSSRSMRRCPRITRAQNPIRRMTYPR